MTVCMTVCMTIDNKIPMLLYVVQYRLYVPFETKIEKDHLSKINKYGQYVGACFLLSFYCVLALNL